MPSARDYSLGLRGVEIVSVIMAAGLLQPAYIPDNHLTFADNAKLMKQVLREGGATSIMGNKVFEPAIDRGRHNLFLFVRIRSIAK